MNAFKAAFSSFSLWPRDKPLPEPEAFCAAPRPMTGFLGTLTDEQRTLAGEYRGDDTHGDKTYAR